MLSLVTSLSLAVLPYVDIPELNLGPIPIRPFGVLVVIGILAGSHIATKRAVAQGISEEKFSSLVFWTVSSGIVISHVVDTILYYPETLINDPLYIIQIHKGLSSFGGLFGAMTGFFWYGMKHKMDLFRCADAIALGLPTGFFFGRMCCAVVHDHPGMHSQSFLAVAFPDGPRFDLGLIEMLLLPILMAAVYIVSKKTSRPGALIATLALVYPFIRFPLDYMRAGQAEGGDIRYFGFTPGQYMCVLTLALGVFLWKRSKDKALLAQAAESERPAGKKPKHKRAEAT